MKKAAIFFVNIIFLITAAWGGDYKWTGNGDGDSWSDIDNWEDGDGDPVVFYPGEDADDDTVLIEDGTVILDVPDVEIAELTINGGALAVQDDFTVTGNLTMTDGELTLAGSETVGSSSLTGGTIVFTGNGTDFAGITDFFNLTIEDGNRTGAGDIAVSGDFILEDGSLDAETVSVTGNSTINADITTIGGQSYNGDVTLRGDLTLTADGGINLNGNVELDETVTADIKFAGTLILPAAGLTFTALSGGTISFADVSGGNLAFEGGSYTAPIGIRSDAGTVMEGITIAADCYVKVSDGQTITQADDSALTLAAGSTVLDTSAGSWYLGTGVTPPDAFAGYNGALVIGAGAKLISNNLNLAGPSFEIQNAGEAVISVKGDVNMADDTNVMITGDLPRLVLEMSGNGTQSLRTARSLGSLHVEAGSTTNMTGDMAVMGKLQITYPGVLNAGNSNIVMIAGLDETKDGSPAKVGRWEIINAPETISANAPVLSYTMNAFRQASGGSVTFERDDALDDNVFFEILGNTVWQKFVCNEAGATFQFSTYPDQHVFLDTFSVNGNSVDYITLTRYTGSTGWVYKYDGSQTPPAAGLPGVPVSRVLKNETEEELEKFWNFNLVMLEAGAEQQLLDISYVTIYFSHAWNQRISIAADNMHLNVIPFYRDNAVSRTGYFNYDWIDARRIIYSFAEDSNGNGQVDRIRVQANVPLNGNFSGFSVKIVEIEGRSVDLAIDDDKDFALVNTTTDSDSFYIYIEEPSGLYDGSPIKWRVTNNDALNIDSAKTDETFITISTIPPRVSYALTLPGHKETYIRMSQPVTGVSAEIDGKSITKGDLNQYIRETESRNFTLEYYFSDGSSKKYNIPEKKGALSYLVELDTAPTVSDLAKLPPIGSETDQDEHFSLQGLGDLAVRALDLNDEKVDPEEYLFYPSPKYPVDWNYSGYKTYTGNSHLTGEGLSDDDAGNPDPDTEIFIPPNKVLTPRMIRALERGEPVTPGDFGVDTGERRSTDVLVSVPLSSGDSEDYFAWPVWAGYQDPVDSGNFLLSDDLWNRRNTSSGNIRKFNGTQFLENNEIVLQFVLQAWVNKKLSASGLSVFYAYDVPAKSRNPANEGEMGKSSGGLWLPEGSPNPLFHIVPAFYPGVLSLPLPSSDSLFTYKIEKAARSGSRLDFLFRLEGISGADDALFVARLDVASGDAIPENWHALVRPFTFDIQDVRLQRGGVTVLNNVINPNNNDAAYVRYQLERPGRVTVQVYTLDGTLVKSLRRNEYLNAGIWTDAWDGKNNGGRAAARGMYFVRVVGPDINEIRKIMVIK